MPLREISEFKPILIRRRLSKSSSIDVVLTASVKSLLDIEGVYKNPGNDSGDPNGANSTKYEEIFENDIDVRKKPNVKRSFSYNIPTAVNISILAVTPIAPIWTDLKKASIESLSRDQTARLTNYDPILTKTSILASINKFKSSTISLNIDRTSSNIHCKNGESLTELQSHLVSSSSTEIQKVSSSLTAHSADHSVSNTLDELYHVSFSLLKFSVWFLKYGLKYNHS